MQHVCLFGPPGTGKTTSLTRAIAHYVQDYGPDKILATSFTKAGARELAGRNRSVLDAHMMGTLHAFCFRALDAPPIAETMTAKGGWNTTYPHMALPPMARHEDTATTTTGEDPDAESPGPRLLHEYSVWRQIACRRDHPPPHLGAFPRLWEDWKHQIGALDFADLLLEALDVLPVAPGNPRMIVVDEAQDLTPLQWRLIGQWGRSADKVLLAGDDDQALYTWCGASPQPMLAMPDDDKIVLGQSYRLPHTIYRYAHTYLDRITRRQAKVWAPRDAPGRQMLSGLPFRLQAQQSIRATLAQASGTCAILAPCSSMVDPLVRWMRQEGIPFANPWRERRGDWNPLRRPARGLSASTRLLDFLRPASRLWTWQELATWLPLVRVRGTLRHDSAQVLARHAEEPRVCTHAELTTLVLPEIVEGALRGGLDWLETRLLADRARAMAYPLRVVRQYGREALAREPNIYVGTCHSVKGGEADTVVLCTALARRFALARAAGGEEADSVERMLYVGATRARESLIVCARI